MEQIFLMKSKIINKEKIMTEDTKKIPRKVIRKIGPFIKGSSVIVIDGERKGLRGIVHTERETPQDAIVNIDGVLHKIKHIQLESLEQT